MPPRARQSAIPGRHESRQQAPKQLPAHGKLTRRACAQGVRRVRMCARGASVAISCAPLLCTPTDETAVAGWRRRTCPQGPPRRGRRTHSTEGNPCNTLRTTERRRWRIVLLSTAELRRVPVARFLSTQAAYRDQSRLAQRNSRIDRWCNHPWSRGVRAKTNSARQRGGRSNSS
jgi:hypothetical protein